jgi:hypothetical protein
MERISDWAGQARDWLDARGLIAWLGAMVLGFIVFWPMGLAVLFYMIWSKRMTCRGWKHGNGRRPAARGATGNSAFDAYRDETLKRLEEERDAFVAFLDELRAAKDRTEFEQFMARRPEQTA